MKRVVNGLLVTVFLLGMTFTVEAQVRQERRQGDKVEMRQGVRGDMHQGEHKMISPEKRAEQMAKQLNLSDAERIKLQALFEKQEARVKLHREEMKKKMEENRAKMEVERKANETELVKIIGAEKFQELQRQRIARLERENRMLKMRMEHQPGELQKKVIEKRKHMRKPVAE